MFGFRCSNSTNEIPTDYPYGHIYTILFYFKDGFIIHIHSNLVLHGWIFQYGNEHICVCHFCQRILRSTCLITFTYGFISGFIYWNVQCKKKDHMCDIFFFNILSTDLNTILFLFFAKPIVYVTTGNLFYSMKIFIDCLTLEFICPLVVIRRQTHTGRLFLLWNVCVCVCIWFFHSKLFSIFISASEKKFTFT